MGHKRKAPELSNALDCCYLKDEKCHISYRPDASSSSVLYSGDGILVQHLQGFDRKEMIQMDGKRRSICARLLKSLMSRQFGDIFNYPVDPVLLNIPDYFDIISNPMDLGTIKERMESTYYATTSQFAADVRLTFENAMTYNPPENDVHILAKSFLSDFTKKWKALELKWETEVVSRKKDTKADTKIQTNVTKKASKIRHLEPSQESKGPSSCYDAKRKRSIDYKDNNPQPPASNPLNNMLNQAQENSFSEASPKEETHSYEEPVSPNRALRAAMLKSRFAGTIVKAQLLAQDKEINPARLQLEKERLERSQQEERLKIEAQVKAAEAASKMQAEAALRVRRKEREMFRSSLEKAMNASIDKCCHASYRIRKVM